MEQDLAHRFGVFQSNASRVTTIWINLLYLKLKEILIWLKKECVRYTMPHFKKQYPSTLLLMPQNRKMTIRIYKGLIGILPNGVVTFISSLYLGSISDKELHN